MLTAQGDVHGCPFELCIAGFGWKESIERKSVGGACECERICCALVHTLSRSFMLKNKIK
jgi:hypothetical protein